MKTCINLFCRIKQFYRLSNVQNDFTMIRCYLIGYLLILTDLDWLGIKSRIYHLL